LHGDILGLQSGPDFELFVKSGVSAFGLEVSKAARKLARAETAAGQPQAGTAGGPGAAGGAIPVTGPAAAVTLAAEMPTYA
jgi:hypothetical protein